MTRHHEKGDSDIGRNKPLNDYKKVIQKPIVAVREVPGTTELVVIDESKRSCDTYSVYKGERKADKIVRAIEPMSTLLRSEVKQLVTCGVASFGNVRYSVSTGEVAIARAPRQGDPE
jgi:hypothetical protein